MTDSNTNIAVMACTLTMLILSSILTGLFLTIYSLAGVILGIIGMGLSAWGLCKAISEEFKREDNDN